MLNQDNEDRLIQKAAHIALNTADRTDRLAHSDEDYEAGLDPRMPKITTPPHGPSALKERWFGYYATRIYPPFSALAQRWQRISHRLRGKQDPFVQTTRLPSIGWRACVRTPASPRLVEPEKANGNVRLSELGILAAVASDLPDGAPVFEIGTFDGRTTLNLALNAPPGCTVHTLDLPPDRGTVYELAEGESHMVDKPRPGVRYEAYRSSRPSAVSRIHQHLGDSASFDFSPFHDACSMVFVDGSHAYAYTLNDTRVAVVLARRGGVVLWHDYGVWPGVTKALEEIEEQEHLGLRNVRGTSLVWWRKP